MAIGAEHAQRSFLHARLRRRGQGGFTLLEAIVSLGLVSTVILVLAGGLLTSVKSSQSAKQTQEIDAALSAVAESYRAAPPTSCTVTSITVVDYSMSVEAIESLAPTSTTSTPPVWGACSDPPYRLTIKLTGTDGSSATGQVVVGAP